MEVRRDCVSLSSFYAIIFIFCSLQMSAAQKSAMTRDSECYTANGNDYAGKQNTTYIKGNAAYEPTEVHGEPCLPWKDQDTSEFNVTLPENYCRNPNNKLFPWCFVDRGGIPTFAYCHIPTCNTPALIGCFKVLVSGSPNVNATDRDLILDGEDSMNDDDEMRIARCLNFCRSKDYDYGGVTGGNNCMCGTEEKDGAQMKDVLNQLHPHDCLIEPCADDVMQACGSDTAIAIYDVEAGSCEGTYHDRASGVVYSPRWPGNYHNEARCGWTVYIPDQFRTSEEIMQRHKLIISFSYFNLEKDNDTIKIYVYRNATDSSPVLKAKYSGNETPANVSMFLTEVFAIHIVFNSDPNDKHDGFILHYDIIDTNPPALTTTTTSTTQTPRRTTTLPPKPTNPTGSTLATTSTTDRNSAASKSPTTATTSTTTTTTAAGGVAGAPKTTKASATTTKNTTTAAPSAAKFSSDKGGKIAGIVLGVLVVLVLLILGVTAFMKYRKRKAEKEAAVPNPPAMFDNPVCFPTDTTL